MIRSSMTTGAIGFLIRMWPPQSRARVTSLAGVCEVVTIAGGPTIPAVAVNEVLCRPKQGRQAAAASSLASSGLRGRLERPETPPEDNRPTSAISQGIDHLCGAAQYRGCHSGSYLSLYRR